MKIKGNYKNFNAETFTITLSYKDIVDLDLALNCQYLIDEDPQARGYKFAKLINAVVNEREFGFDITTMYIE